MGYNAGETAPSHGSAKKPTRSSGGDAQARFSQQRPDQRELGDCVQLIEATELDRNSDESPLVRPAPRCHVSDKENEEDSFVSDVNMDGKAVCKGDFNAEEDERVERFSGRSSNHLRQPSSVDATVPVSPCIEPLVSSSAPLDCPQASAARRTARSPTARGAARSTTLVDLDNDEEESSLSSSSSVSSPARGSEDESSCDFDSDASAGVIEDFTTGVDAWLEDVQSVGRQDFFGLFKRDVTPQFSRPARSVLGRNVSVSLVELNKLCQLVLRTSKQ